MYLATPCNGWKKPGPLYINDDYTGGNIRFNAFDYTYHPKPGDLICFPSDHRNIHTAEPVTSGFRYAIVSWCAVKESQKVRSMPPAEAIVV